MSSCGFFENRATQYFLKAVDFEDTPQQFTLPTETSYAKKRGFGDFNNDGIEDMYEISNNFFGGGDYELQVFLGDTSQNTLQFSDVSQKYQLAIDLSWFSSATKVDVADVNNDGYSDIVFTQYTQSVMGDEMNVSYAFNTGKETFISHTKNIQVENVDLSTVLLRIISGYSYDEEQSIYDFLKMDWGDMNGDEIDDLVLLWKDGNNIDIEIFYGIGDGNFSNYQSYYVDNFLYNRKIQDVDIENYTGDKNDDILVRKVKYGGEILIVRVLENAVPQTFLPHHNDTMKTADLDLFAFEKFDSFDLNNDGYADIVHVGEKDNQKICVFNLRKK